MTESRRRLTREVRVGDVTIGGRAPIAVQTMTNSDTCDVAGTLAQIRAGSAAGADIVRLAIPNMDAVTALRDIIPDAGLPIVADVHFDYRLAVGAAVAGAHKLRINPGNIGDDERLRSVVEAAAEHGIPIRIGVNAGSLERELLTKYGHPTPEALVESAFRNVERVQAMGFGDLVVSIKASDVSTTVAANRLFAAGSDLPLHVGITEAGIGRAGIVHSAVGIGVLLEEGIGDTIRVSLTGHIVEEVLAGRDILLALGLISGPRLVSCPTCGRCQVDLPALAAQVAEFLARVEQPLLVAVMGCEVNGPGEAREADVGLAAGRDRATLFTRGEIVKTVRIDEALEALQELIMQAIEDEQ